MKNIRRLSLAFFAGLFVIASAVVAVADPPGRVARIDYMTGGVSVQPGGVKDWVNAELNRPLTTADRVWTDKDSRAELHLGTAYMRMSSETSITLTSLTDVAVQIELDQGTVNLRVRHLYPREIYEIDTPNLAFTVTKSGEYRFDVDPNGDVTLVTVRKGEGEATGENRAVRVRGGEQARFRGGTSLSHNIEEAPERDGFDDWCRVRDRRQESYGSYRYVSPYVIGADDLDDYGTWRVAPAYGPIWVPAVAPGWAPYRYGHWIWVEPWGWTWVDDAPWGFAPCHYGRWVYYGGYWGWAPGPVIVRPVYAPALVAWFGGEHWGVGISFGGPSVGWFPLGYGEPYVPPYYVSRNYFHNVNVNNTRITNVTNITNIYNTTYNTTNNTVRINNIDNSIHGNRNKVVTKYANREVPGAVTAVPRDVMVNSRPVQRAALRLSDNDVRGAHIGMAAPVAPTKSSVLGASGPSPLPPAHVQPRNVVSRMAPPPRPIPFSAKQQALEARPGRPLDSSTERQLRANMGNPRGPAREMGVADKPATNMPAARTPIAQPKTAESGEGSVGRTVHNVRRPPDRTINGRGQQMDVADLPAQRRDSDTPAHTAPRPPDRTYTGRQHGPTATEVPIPRSTEADNIRPDWPSTPAHSVPRPPDRTYTGRQPNSAREVQLPREADTTRNVRQDRPRAPVHDVPRPPETMDRGNFPQADRPVRSNMPPSARADRVTNMDRSSNMDRPNMNRSVSRPESNSRPMMDSPRANYPRAESRSMPQRDVYESRRMETRPAEYPSARVQREPSVVRSEPPRQSAPAESHRGAPSQQSRGNGRDSHDR